MGKYKTLIIGAGGQGALADSPGSGNENKIISFGHAFSEHPEFELDLFVDINIEKAVKASKIWRVSMTLSSSWDVIVITTPDDSHYGDLELALKHSPKLVICEKPLCTNLQQAREIVELYKAKGIPLMVNYTRRFLPYYEDLKYRYECGDFGKLIKASATFNRGFLHSGSHAIDLFEWLFPGPEKCWLDHIEGADYRIWQLEIFFEKYHWREERIGEQPVWPYYDRSHWYVVDNAYQFLEGNEPLKCTSEDALKTLEICFELMKK